MKELQKTFSLLDRLEDLNKSKFNSSDFSLLNKEFETSLNNIVEITKDQITDVLTIDDKKNIYDLISKIEVLEQKFAPKVNLMNSFAKSIK